MTRRIGHGKKIYGGAWKRRDELCGPYADVIEFDVAQLPSNNEVAHNGAGRSLAIPLFKVQVKSILFSATGNPIQHLMQPGLAFASLEKCYLVQSKLIIIHTFIISVIALGLKIIDTVT